MFKELKGQGQSTREGKDAVAVLRKAGEKRGAATGFVVGIVEAGRHRGPEERGRSARKQARALPDTARDGVLKQHAGGEIVAQRDGARSAVVAKQECLDGITHIEVEHFIARKAMERGKRFMSKHIEDSRGGETVAGICVRQNRQGKLDLRAVGFNEVAAFNGVRAKVEKRDDLFGG